MSRPSTFLFAEPTFLSGVARIFDFAGSLNEYNHSLTPEQANRIALRNDWEAVGDALRTAVDEYRRDMSQSQRGQEE